MDKEEYKKYQRDWMRRKRAKVRAALSEAELQNIEEHKLSGRFKKGQLPWNRGSKGAQVAWNKGLTKETDERVAKNAVATSKGVKLLWLQPLYCGGNKKGVKFNLSPTQKRAYSHRLSGRGNPMYGRSGEKSPVWLGGVSFEPYPSEFNNKLKRKIKVRDGYQCQLCGTKEKLAVHHIDYDKQNNKINNLITLCLSCNVKVNKNREHWTDYFQRRISWDSQNSVSKRRRIKTSPEHRGGPNVKTRVTRGKPR